MALADHEDRAPEIERSIVRAREGSLSTLGQLLELYRGYLLATANEKFDSDLVPKEAPSDVVQESLLQAVRDFPKFRGGTEPELRYWLQQILLHNVADVHRRYRDSSKRRASLETSIHGNSDAANSVGNLVSREESPGSTLHADENAARVREAIERLPEDHRRVILLRNYQGMPFEDIGAALGKSSEAARKLWSRAIERLAGELGDDDRGG